MIILVLKSSNPNKILQNEWKEWEKKEWKEWAGLAQL